MKNKLFSNLKTLTSIFSVAILVITVVMLMLRLTVFSPNKDRTKSSDPVSSNVNNPDAENPEDVFEFNYSISSHIVFKDFNATANPQIESSASNKNLMQIKIIREDNKSLVYSSDYIKPGFNVRTMKLEGQPMEAGEYICKAEIIVMNLESSEVIETLTETITIEIENSLPERQ